MGQGTVIVRKRKDPLSSEAMERIVEMLWNLRFGSITLVVNEGRVAQIDRTEKFRLNNRSGL
jgi:hypothetical protein